MNQITALLMNLVAPGLWQAAVLTESDKVLAQACGQPLLLVDLEGATSKSAMMDALARDLEFGSYFGKNFDALEECLLDLETAGVVVILNGSDLVRSDRPTVKTLNEVFGDVARLSARSFVWIAAQDLDIPTIPVVNAS